MEMDLLDITESRTLHEMFRDYLWETLQRKIIYAPWGFATYDVHQNYIFLADLYIEPKLRGSGVCREFLLELEEIAKAVNRSYIGTKVHTLDKAWQNNLAICEHLGFRRAKVSPEYIFLMKRRGD